MKAFLKNVQGIFLLGPHTTTVGRVDCDLIVQAMDIDHRHAIIEFDAKEGEFVLQDLNSTHGTFVNDVNVKDAAVPLTHGDFIRFGHPGAVFQFICDIYKKVAPCLPLDKRPNYLASHPAPPQVVYIEGLPQLRSTTIKEHRLVEDEAEQVVENAEEINPEEQSRWIVGPYHSKECDYILNPEDETLDNMRVVITCLREELRRVSVFEGENMFKDDLVDQLKNEVAYLQMKLRQYEVGARNIITHDDLSNCEAGICPLQLVGNTSQKMVDRIKDAIEEPPEAKDSRKVMPSSVDVNKSSSRALIRIGSRHSYSTSQESQLGSFDPSAAGYNYKSEELNKELISAKGLVATLQKNLELKDETMRKLAQEGDRLRQDLIDQADLALSLKQTIDALTDKADLAEILVQREKEIFSLQRKLNFALAKHVQVKTETKALQSELLECRKSERTEETNAYQLMREAESSNAKLQELERLDQVNRIDIEQLNKRLEKLRGQLFQAAHNQPTIKSATKKISDDELVAALKKCLDQVSGEDSGKHQIPETGSDAQLKKEHNRKK